MFGCSYFQPSKLFQHLNLYHYGFLGYSSGVIVSIYIDDLYSNKWQKYYNEISYTKILFNFWSIAGLCGGLYYGHRNKLLQ